MAPLASVQRLNANELQRLVFNAAGNIGMTEAIVENQGITPANSPTINGYINTAITMLDQLAGQYNDPPFDSGQIRKIASMLRRFPQATDRMNNRGKASYLRNCYTNLKSAMSAIFRSNLGLRYNATCDTFVADLGYNGGKALAGIMLNNRFIENEGRSGINLALGSGTRTRDTLGCSFLTADQIRALDIQNRRTSADFSAMVRELEGDVRVASLNMEPGFDSPATKGKVTAPEIVDPPPPANPPADANDLTGSWKDGQAIITKEGGYYVARAYFKNVPNYYWQAGYHEGMVFLKFPETGSSSYSQGQYFLFLYGERGIFVDAAIEHIINPATNQETLKIHYTYKDKKSWVAFSRFRR